MKPLRELRPAYVVGIGLHAYQAPSATPYTVLGVTAVREALADAGIAWRDVEAAYTGTATTSMALSRLMYRHLGSTGIAMAQVENASASGSTAVRQAAIDVASGLHDVVVATGVDKPMNFSAPQRAAGVRDLTGGRIAPVTHFALLANRYMYEHSVSAEDIARVAVKNSANGARNPHAQRQQALSLEEVMAPPLISGSLTRAQCCPIGEGAAAVVVASNEAIVRLGLSRARAVRIVASVAGSERVYGAKNHDAELTRETTEQAYEDAGIGPGDLDVVELHDAFSIEEVFYVESMGLAEGGRAPAALAAREFDIGGRVAVSASGGLLSMGHPIGPTGAGQICEITRQLRGEAGDRQQPNARVGLAHMVGVGAVCVVHILQRAD
jgi:acetyl-CoA acetyltransferase